MAVVYSTVRDYERELAEIVNRLGKVREALGLSQAEFASQISVTRDRMASIEDGRTVLRCDVALRACRQFFINEFWLCYGATDEDRLKAKKLSDFGAPETRLTMSLVLEPVFLTSPPEITFADGFERFLRQTYFRLCLASGGFPRVVFLPSDGPEFANNAMRCFALCWRERLTAEQWVNFFPALLMRGSELVAEIKAKYPDAGDSLSQRINPNENKGRRAAGK